MEPPHIGCYTACGKSRLDYEREAVGTLFDCGSVAPDHSNRLLARIQDRVSDHGCGPHQSASGISNHVAPEQHESLPGTGFSSTPREFLTEGGGSVLELDELFA